MPKHWPHVTHMQVKDQDVLEHMLTWCYIQWGDSQYQHWCAEYAPPDLKIMFCDRSYKLLFDLTFGVTTNQYCS